MSKVEGGDGAATNEWLAHKLAAIGGAVGRIEPHARLIVRRGLAQVEAYDVDATCLWCHGAGWAVAHWFQVKSFADARFKPRLTRLLARAAAAVGVGGPSAHVFFSRRNLGGCRRRTPRELVPMLRGNMAAFSMETLRR